MKRSLDESTQKHTETWNILANTDAFLNQKRVNVCEHAVKMVCSCVHSSRDLLIFWWVFPSLSYLRSTKHFYIKGYIFFYIWPSTKKKFTNKIFMSHCLCWGRYVSFSLDISQSTLSADECSTTTPPSPLPPQFTILVSMTVYDLIFSYSNYKQNFINLHFGESFIKICEFLVLLWGLEEIASIRS